MMPRSLVPSRKTPAPTPLQQIQSLYHKLNDTDRKKLRLFIKAPAASEEIVSESNDWLLTGIMSELARRGLKYSSRQHNAQVLSSSYATDSEVVRKELLRGLKRSIPQPRYQELLALGKVVARALAEYLDHVASVGLKMMLNNVGKSLEALDASYPGYLSAGLLGQLISVYVKESTSNRNSPHEKARRAQDD